MGNSDKETILQREDGQRLGLELAGLPGQVVQSSLLGQGPEQPDSIRPVLRRRASG